jgi:hypothetical protein
MWVGLHNYINDTEFADLKTMKKSSLKETVFKNMPRQPCSPRLQLFMSKKCTRLFSFLLLPFHGKKIDFYNLSSGKWREMFLAQYLHNRNNKHFREISDPSYY